MRTRNTKKSTTTRRTIGYTRVSTAGQAVEGVSLDQQRARIAAYCVSQGFPEPEVIEDAGTSAGSLKRAGIATVLDAVRSGEVERVIVCKLDRLSRSARDLDDLFALFAKHGVALISVSETFDTTSATGRAMRSMTGIMAQMEREQIGERTSAALAHKRTTRSAYSPVPFGYERVGTSLVPNVVEQAHLAEAVALDRAGASYREIARALTARGARPKRGGSVWYASSVQAILRSKMTTESHAA